RHTRLVSDWSSDVCSSDLADDVDRLAGTSFGVTAPEVLRPAAEALVIEMGGEPVFIAEEHRDLYHAALAGAANHLITLVAQAMRSEERRVGKEGRARGGPR